MASFPDGKPLDETPEALRYDSVNLMARTAVGNVAYGIMLALYAICVYNLWARMTSENRRTSTFYLCYITVMAIFGTLYVISNTLAADLAYVKHRLYPGGPGAYTLSNYLQPSVSLGNVSWILINSMADGLVLWRFIVVYLNNREFYVIAIAPCLIYVGSICFGTLVAIQSASQILSEGIFRANTMFNYALVYLSLSISLTCLVTTAIIGKLYYHRRHIQRTYSLRNHYGNQYTSITAMLIESAALYTLFCLIFIVLYGTFNTMQWVFLSLLAQVQIIAPLLIIFRVSQGRAWSRDTHSTLFSTFSNPETQSSTDDDVFLDYRGP